MGIEPNIGRTHILSAQECRDMYGVELQSCPFCGSRSVGLRIRGRTSRVICVLCESEGPKPTPRRDRFRAIQRWNSRY